MGEACNDTPSVPQPYHNNFVAPACHLDATSCNDHQNPRGYAATNITRVMLLVPSRQVLLPASITFSGSRQRGRETERMSSARAIVGISGASWKTRHRGNLRS
jgi:hypothetical protein